MDTVPDAKHVRYFVSHDCHRAEFDEVIVYLVLLQLEEALVVPREGENPSSFLYAGQPEHEVPLFTRVKVSHAHPNHAKRVSW
jgi:hypothetical protein